MFWYGLLETFVREHGHCQVAALYKTDDGYRLGSWINTQRTNRKTIRFDRREQLEAVPGWSWDVISDQWNEGFSHLKAFAEREGHCRVLLTYRAYDGYRLGQWVGVQRTKKAVMPLERRQRLEALPGWSWDAISDQWNEGLEHLKAYAEREGHCRVPAQHRTAEGFRLGLWVTNRRAKMDFISKERQQLLESMPGWSWDPHADKWEEGFYHLKAYAEREEHCRMGQTYKANDGYQLGRWLSKQRSKKKTMPLERRQRLEALPGWSWDAISDQWNEGFAHLKAYAEREGHCRVPAQHRTAEGFRLGQWGATQRGARETMDPDRRQRLEALPGWSWDVLSDQWNEGFSHLKAFAEREGHCRVPSDYRTFHGFGLGLWVVGQRSRREALPSERRLRLEALSGWSWDPFADRWDEGFAHLEAYAKREGHCRVPAKYKDDDGYRVGQWVGVQRGDSSSHRNLIVGDVWRRYRAGFGKSKNDTSPEAVSKAREGAAIRSVCPV